MENNNSESDDSKNGTRVNRFDVTKVLNKMNSAIKMNEHLKRESGSAQLVIINIPTPPKKVNKESVKKCKTHKNGFFLQILTKVLNLQVVGKIKILLIKQKSRQ